MSIADTLGAVIAADMPAVVTRALATHQAPDLRHLPGDDHFQVEPVKVHGRQRQQDTTPGLLAPGAALDMPYGAPVDGPISSVFGLRWHPILGRLLPHTGEDIAAHEGSTVHATAMGIVTRAEWSSGGYGNVVEIDHGNGFKTRYGHLHSIVVTQGEHVARGEAIGTVGRTGRATGSHLHYEVLHHNRFENPLQYLAKAH